MADTQQDILTDIVTSSELVQASSGKRFLNLLIDSVAIRMVIYCFDVVWLLVNPEISGDTADYVGFSLWMILGGLLLNVFYYGVFELLTKGRTLGKFITGTKAVYEDGSDITAGTAFKRALSRMVPFEPFSAFGSPPYPWHDSWTHTCVIDIKQTTMLHGMQHDHHNNNASL